jgi:hydrogenase maturation protease
MPALPAGRTVVLGLGNPCCGDDGVGPAVAAACQRLLRERPVPGVDVLTSTRAGFELIDLLHGYSRAVIVDCLDLPAPRPGAVRRLTLEEVGGVSRLVGAHEISLCAAFRLAARLAIPMPAEVEVLAVEGEDLRTLGGPLTPAVHAAVEPLARAIHGRLQAAQGGPPPPDDEAFRQRRELYAPEG